MNPFIRKDRIFRNRSLAPLFLLPLLLLPASRLAVVKAMGASPPPLP